MSLTQRVATIYKHIQDVPALEWTISHNLGGYPIVDCYVDNEGIKRVMPSTVVFVDENTCTVSFNSAYAGFATVV